MLCGQEHLHHSPRLGVRCSKNSLKKVWQWDPWDSVRTQDDMLNDSWLWRSEEVRKTCHLWNNALFLCVSIILQMLASSQGLGSKQLHMFFLNRAFFFFMAALVDRVVARPVDRSSSWLTLIRAAPLTLRNSAFSLPKWLSGSWVLVVWVKGQG